MSAPAGRALAGRAPSALPGPDPREAAFAVLYRVESGRAFANILLHRVLERAAYAPADQALVTEVVLGTLRQQGRLDYALELALQRPLASLPPAIRTILRLGLYQVWFLDRVPDAAAVHQAVEAAKRHGHAGTARLVNAVLRRLAAEGEPPPPRPEDDPVGHVAVTHSHPRWLVQRWIARWGAEAPPAPVSNTQIPQPTNYRE
ncbi:MAG: hypothetical protein K6V36_06525 [Anaerolineae bacterium]|nr:hypothetical protein [Anaerolineae bacterium]